MTLIFITTISLLWKSDTVTYLLTGELSFPLREALKLQGIQVGQVVRFIFQGLLLQAERSQTSGCISACKHSIWPLCKTDKTQRKPTLR